MSTKTKSKPTTDEDALNEDAERFKQDFCQHIEHHISSNNARNEHLKHMSEFVANMPPDHYLLRRFMEHFNRTTSNRCCVCDESWMPDCFLVRHRGDEYGLQKEQINKATFLLLAAADFSGWESAEYYEGWLKRWFDSIEWRIPNCSC